MRTEEELETSRRRSWVKRMGGNFKMRQYISAKDEELYKEHVDVEANPLRELPLARINEPQRRRARQLASTLTMHTKRSSIPDDRESERSSEWTRNLETFSGRVGAGARYRAMLMQLPQFPFTGDGGQALEEWEELVRQYEAQSSDTLQDTIKAAILLHNPEDAEWRRHVGLNATRLQKYDALRIEWKAMHQATMEYGRRKRCHTDGS